MKNYQDHTKAKAYRKSNTYITRTAPFYDTVLNGVVIGFYSLKKCTPCLNFPFLFFLAVVILMCRTLKYVTIKKANS